MQFSNDPVDEVPDHVTVVNNSREGMRLIAGLTKLDESSIRPATPLQGVGPDRNSLTAEQVQVDPSDQVGGPVEIMN